MSHLDTFRLENTVELLVTVTFFGSKNVSITDRATILAPRLTYLINSNCLNDGERDDEWQ